MSLTNAERQKRFRQLTLKERQLKADLLDCLVAAIDSKQAMHDELPLPDGRSLKYQRSDGNFLVEIVSNARLQLAIKQTYFRSLYQK